MADGAQQVREMYRRALSQDKRDQADLISSVSKALGGPELSPLDNSLVEVDLSDAVTDETMYAEYQRLAGTGGDG